MEDFKEEEMDKIIEEEIQKDIDQSESIDEELVDSSLKQMGFLWESLMKKLQEDSTCFQCKGAVDFSGGNLQVLMANTTDKGLVAFVGVCNNCHAKLEKEYMEGLDDEKKKD